MVYVIITDIVCGVYCKCMVYIVITELKCLVYVIIIEIKCVVYVLITEIVSGVRFSHQDECLLGASLFCCLSHFALIFL